MQQFTPSPSQYSGSAIGKFAANGGGIYHTKGSIANGGNLSVRVGVMAYGEDSMTPRAGTHGRNPRVSKGRRACAGAIVARPSLAPLLTHGFLPLKVCESILKLSEQLFDRTVYQAAQTRFVFGCGQGASPERAWTLFSTLDAIPRTDSDN